MRPWLAAHPRIVTLSGGLQRLDGRRDAPTIFTVAVTSAMSSRLHAKGDSEPSVGFRCVWACKERLLLTTSGLAPL